MLHILVTFYIIAANGHTGRGVVAGCGPETPEVERMRSLLPTSTN